MFSQRHPCTLAPNRARRSSFTMLLALWLALSTTGCELAMPDKSSFLESEEPLSIIDGEDYRLPTWVTSEPYSGYVNHPQYGDPAIGGGQRNLTLFWVNVEPERGQYDWSALESALNAAEAGGYTIQLRLQGVVCGGGTQPNTVPPWVIEDFNITATEQVRLSGNFGIRVIPAWRPEICSAFEDMIRNFGERGYPQRAGLGSAYIHAISPSRGEEFGLSGGDIYALELFAGLTPQLLEEWLASRMRVFAEVFGSQRYKLAWVGRYSSLRYSGAEYAAVALRLLHEAWDLGLGNRNGGIERYLQALQEPAFGQAIDDNGYITVDETIPPIADRRYFGEENEEYGDAWTWRFGDRNGEPQRYRFSMLRALQMRLRFLWTSAAAEQINPPLSEYARLSFGKTVENSPDAWAYLSETPAGSYWSSVGAVKNFERWLLQRDVPEGMTVPAERFDREFNAGAVSSGQVDLYYDHLARRTDVENGSPYIYFDLDDRFHINGRAQIKVEYLDDSDTCWRLEYLDDEGVLASTPAVHNRGDGEVRTATFAIDDAQFNGGLPHNMDFRIVCAGPQDVTVRWVRVIRTDGP